MNVGEKILFVLTNNNKLGDTGKNTGWYLPEVARPYNIWRKAGIDITFASPNGGKTPMDPSSEEKFKDDDDCKEFLRNRDAQNGVNNTVPLRDIRPLDFNAIYIPGGHGPMWDLPDCKELQNIVGQNYEHGGVIASICHGVCAFLHALLPNGDNIVLDRNMTCFSDAEEKQMGLEHVVPFSLEHRLRERGAHIQFAKEPGGECVVVDEKVVTGQNPASANKLANEVLRLMNRTLSSA